MIGRPSWITVAGPPAVAAAAGLAEVVLLRHDAATLVGVLVATAALLWRRRFPLGSAVVAVAAIVVAAIVLGPGATTVAQLGAVAVALYTVASHGPGRWRLPAAATLLVAALAAVPQLSSGVRLVALTAAVALGAVVRAMRERQRELATRLALLHHERAEGARFAVFAQRVQIARELHDVVAHHVSAMGVQAAAARLVMAVRPDQAAAALGEIQRSSRTAAHELGQLVGYLRNTAEIQIGDNGRG